MEIRPKDIFKMPNLLSLYRLILAFVFPVLWLKKVSVNILVILLTTAILSDAFDGIFSRIFNQETTLGKLLDPIADKTFINMLYALFYLENYISFKLFFIIIFRDIAILSGAIYLLHKNYTNIKPTILGKISTAFQLLFLLVFFIDFFIYPLNSFVIVCFENMVIFFTLASFLHYSLVFWGILKTSPIK